MPDGIDGGISTMPLSYKPWLNEESEQAEWQAIVSNLVRLTRTMAPIASRHGKLIHLDIEPEPDGLIENTGEVIAFYNLWLLPVGGPMLAAALDIPEQQARPVAAPITFASASIAATSLSNMRIPPSRWQASCSGHQIGRVQLSSALKVGLPTNTGRLRFRSPIPRTCIRSLKTEDVCLHHYPDLPDAIAAPPNRARNSGAFTFMSRYSPRMYDGFQSTQEDVRKVLALAVRDGFTSHLEIETYTWDVLPADHETRDARFHHPRIRVGHRRSLPRSRGR